MALPASWPNLLPVVRGRFQQLVGHIQTSLVALLAFLLSHSLVSQDSREVPFELRRLLQYQNPRGSILY